MVIYNSLIRSRLRVDPLNNPAFDVNWRLTQSGLPERKAVNSGKGVEMMVAERRDRSGKKKKSSYIRVGVGYADEQKLRAKVRGNYGDGSKGVEDVEPEYDRLPARNPDTGRPKTFLPSEPWIDTHFNQIEDIGPKGKPEVVRYFYRGAKESPLNGAAPGMVRCELCGHLCPPVAIEGGVCMDHRPDRIHRSHGSSPSAALLRSLRERNAKNDEDEEKARDKKLDIQPESKSALRREIKRYLKYNWKPLHRPIV